MSTGTAARLVCLLIIGGSLLSTVVWTRVQRVAAVGSAGAGDVGLYGPLPYLSEADSPFAASIQAGTTRLETFEDGALNTLGVSASTGETIGPSGITDSVDGDDGSIDGSGQNGFSYFASPGSIGVTFSFDAVALGGLPTHAGIVWTD